MRFLIFLTAAFIISILTSCNTTTKEVQVEKTIAATFPERAKDMVIYEVNTRQFTPEGTFQAFIPHMERIRNMGVDILWIMPIQPIGVKNRKGGLGSYYSIKDYKGVNEEYGTLDDFKALVNKAHELNMLVILDWVGNHTAWDHHWMTENPDFYTTDSLGNVISPVPDWADVADLNYDNENMQQAMIADMKYWVENADLDGFRCDVAGFVPMEFWNKAKDSLDQVKDLFMLAEWDEGKMHKDAFHMTYSWGMHHVMNSIAKGEMNVDSIDAFLVKDRSKFQPKDFRLQFTSNHDENSWNGTVYERFGDGAKAYAVFAATIQGMPLLYGGMEAGLNKRLRFFDKDTVDWSDLPLEDFYTTLFKFKKENEALWNGEYGGPSERINVSNKVYAFKREKNGNQVVVIINLSNEKQMVTLNANAPKGVFNNPFGDKMELNENAINIEPWGFYMLTKK